MKAYFDLAEGSPPPMRGKGQNSTVFVEREGIPPAYAGKSSRIANIRAASEDNPRLCGEKAVVGNYNRIFVGSPPPMRGKVFFFDPEHLRIGITPAYAGKSDLMGGFKMAQEDHPRLCGEK